MERLPLDSNQVEQGLAKLVLTIIELLRQLMERQAMRRVESDSLTDEQIEELGLTLMRLEEKMEELKLVFGLEHEDLNIELGPLGKLL
ncbi:gas vesicle protein K [Neobacillus sp. CF12]|uniref:gas vesicle protein K n=1 Tax=Neobacillus sp. CF12 TaxID=3055864 RepID=UPI0025A1BE78|nr:gas vesicle protein K [Neobacillus sp. CF12]MDM5327225.1 gas vesicle protein K [Neobacillus sp. CF12]